MKTPTAPIYGLALLAACAGAFLLGRMSGARAKTAGTVEESPSPDNNPASSPPPVSPFEKALGKLRDERTQNMPADAAGFRRWFDAYNGTDGGSTDTWERMTGWAKLDPEGAWQWLIAGGKEKFKQMGVESTIMAEWARQDPGAAIEALKALKLSAYGERTLSSAVDAAFSALVRVESGDPDLARHLEDLMEMGPNFRPHAFGANAAESVSKLLEPLESYRRLPEGRAKTLVMSALAGALAAEDFSKAVSFVTELPDDTRAAATYQMIQTALYSSATAISPGPGYSRSISGDEGAAQRYESNRAQALTFIQDWFQSSASAEERSGLGALVAKKLAEQDPETAVRWSYENLSGRNLSTSLSNIIASQAKSDLPSARAMVDALPPGPMQMRAASELAKIWIKEDSDTALPWMLAIAEQAGDDFGARDSIGSVAGNWGFENPDNARAFLDANPSLLPRYVDATVRGMTGKEPQATADWAARIPDETLRARALNLTISSWLDKAPAETAAWLSAAEAPENLATELYDTTTRRWFPRDPGAAIQWALALPEGPNRAAALERLRQSIDASSAQPEKVAEWRGQLGG